MSADPMVRCEGSQTWMTVTNGRWVVPCWRCGAATQIMLSGRLVDHEREKDQADA